MPNYIFRCKKCGKEKEITCNYKDKNKMSCECGGKLKIKIAKVNFIIKK